MRRKIEKNNAFTLLEMIAVIAALFVATIVIIPTLQAGKQFSKSEICLSNLKELNTAIRIYAEDYNNQLPGPLHPAIYHHQTAAGYLSSGLPSGDMLEYYLERQLSHRLRPIMGDDVDRTIICPTMAGIATDSHFRDFYEVNQRSSFPFHYALNNWTSSGSSGTVPPSPRATNPGLYFGNQPYFGSPELPVAPQLIGNINRPSEEWMIADAWFRSNSSMVSEFNQEGPYQSEWSGEALPYFAPHFKRGSKTMYPNLTERQMAAIRIRQTQADGLTNTVFFDGHAAAVPSRTFTVNGFKLLYGFPGTVNPLLTTSLGQMAWDSGTWE